MDPSGQAVQLPAGYDVRRVLSRGAQGTVVLCERQGQSVVLRSVPAHPGSAREALAELRVLSALDHPQLARLVDHGLAPMPGELFLVRSWIEGQTLDRHLAALPAEGPARECEVARVFAGICTGLDALHRAGFVHADLKPTNVIVRTDGTPVLTDFGLATTCGQARAGGEVSGSLATLAPEQLAAGVLDARTDLFALGAMLYDALAPHRRDLASFYAHFPAADFFAAAGSEPAVLCEWARTLVGELVLRDPAQRPASAGLVGARLRASAQILGTAVSEERWTWPPSRGRRAWFAGLLERLLAPAAQDSGVLQVALDDTEEASELAAELRLSASLRGARALALDPAADL
jgi:eukaryotic-like serine/threonine-protein kinase